MSFHLTQTPTLEAVATDDEQRLAQDIQARVAEAMTQVETQSAVADARESARAATGQFDQLRIAERALHQLAKEARERYDGIGQAALDALVEAAGSGAKPDWKQAEAAAAIETQIRYAGRAIERLAEHLIPLAQIASLREEAHSLEAKARALEGIAQERAEKLLGQIREAVSGEMVLPVDLSKGVSGALLAKAKDLRARAVQLAREAEERERSYQNRA